MTLERGLPQDVSSRNHRAGVGSQNEKEDRVRVTEYGRTGRRDLQKELREDGSESEVHHDEVTEVYL